MKKNSCKLEPGKVRAVGDILSQEDAFLLLKILVDDCWTGQHNPNDQPYNETHE